MATTVPTKCLRGLCGEFAHTDFSTKVDFPGTSDKAAKHPAQPLRFVRLAELLIFVIYYTPDIASRVDTLRQTHSGYEKVERSLRTLLEDLPAGHAWCNELCVLDVETVAAGFSKMQAQTLDRCVMRMHSNMETAFYLLEALDELEQLQSVTRGFWDKAKISGKLYRLHSCVHRASLGCKALKNILAKLPQFSFSTENLEPSPATEPMKQIYEVTIGALRSHVYVPTEEEGTVKSRSSHCTPLGQWHVCEALSYGYVLCGGG